jgi:hypothetical protein
MRKLIVACVTVTNIVAISNCELLLACNQHRKENPKFVAKTTSVKHVTIRDYDAIVDTKKKTIWISVGDIANTGNIVEFCRELSVEGFEKFPICNTCTLRWDVVAFNDTVSGEFTFVKTKDSVKRVR